MRTFLLSPARCDGERARLLLDPASDFPLAARLRSAEGIELGEAFAFLSALYFRGKLAYARAFAVSTRGIPPALVITTDRGLLPPDTRIRRDDLLRFAEVDIAAGDERYLAPLRRDTAKLARALGSRGCAILLGSIATGKYVDAFIAALGERLLFPAEFVGRGDMSRGGILLRAARANTELEYIPVAGAVRHGRRPPKLEPVR